MSERAASIVFTTENARALYLNKYADLDRIRTAVIENGFDDSLLSRDDSISKSEQVSNEVLVLHSGSLYTDGRDPSMLIRAAKPLGDRLKAQGKRLILRFRGGTEHAKHIQLANDTGAAEYIEYSPRVSFHEAVREMRVAAALVLIQGSVFDLQIPGKAYEYIATRRPILAITSTSGATSKLLSEVDSTVVTEGRDAGSIQSAMERVLTMGPRRCDVDVYDRSRGAERLAELLTAKSGEIISDKNNAME